MKGPLSVHIKSGKHDIMNGGVFNKLQSFDLFSSYISLVLKVLHCIRLFWQMQLWLTPISHICPQRSQSWFWYSEVSCFVYNKLFPTCMIILILHNGFYYKCFWYMYTIQPHFVLTLNTGPVFKTSQGMPCWLTCIWLITLRFTVCGPSVNYYYRRRLQ